MDIYKNILNNSNYHRFFNPGDRVVLEVYFSEGGKTYCYEGDSESYTPGEKVIVSTPEAFKDVTIKDVYYYNQEDYPFEVVSLKRIIKRIDRDSNYYKKKSNNNKPLEIDNLRKIPDEIIDTSQNKHPKNEQVSSAKRQEERRNPWGVIAAIIACIVLFGPTLRDMYIDSIPLEKEDVIGIWEAGESDITFCEDGSVDVGNESVGGDWTIVNSDEKTISFMYSMTDEQVDNYNEMLFEQFPELYYDTEGLGFTEEEIIDDLLDSGIVPEDGEYTVEKRNGIMRNGNIVLNKQ